MHPLDQMTSLTNTMYQMPLFAPASTGNSQAQISEEAPSWFMDSEDPLDVDLLAEYLLDDVGGATSSSKAMDYGGKQEDVPSSIVSPEQSEDGGFPPVAESSHQLTKVLHTGGACPVPEPPSMVTSVPNVAFQVSIPNPTSVTPTAVTPNQEASGLVLSQGAANKRRRVDVLGVLPVPACFSSGPISIQVQQPQQQLQLQQQQVHQRQGQQQQEVHHRVQQQKQQLVAALQQGRGRKKSQAQIDRRRERNRILARRTRLRKKFFFESLQKEVIELQRENSRLKELVRTELPATAATEVLESCKAAESLPQAVVEACGEHAAELDQQDFNLVQSIQSSQHSFVITDPCLQDNPIVFASDGFLKITGFTRENVLGRNCRFLQGTETSQEKVEYMRNAISKGEDVSVTMINYMADGTPFWNKLFIAALRDSQNQIVNFIGVIVKVVGPVEGDPEHGKLLPGEQEKSDEDQVNSDLNLDAESIALAADGTVKAIEGGLSAAVAAVNHQS